MVDPRSGNYGNLPHVGPGNMESFTGRLYDNVNTVKDDALISGKFHFNPGDIIYGKINPQLGKYTYAQFEGLASADAYVLNGKNGLTQEFLFGILQTKAFFDYSVSVSMRSGMPKINRDELNAFEFLAPNESEQRAIGDILLKLDDLITLHQCKCQHCSLCGYLSWEQRKLGELYSLVSEKNDLTFGRESIISVANMYFNANVNVTDEQYLRTYNVMRLGDIAFEGHSNKEFSHGRFVENYIGDGIVSHIFTVLRPRVPFDVNYWRYAINNEKLMRLSLIRSTKASTMMHDLVPSDFLREAIPTPTLAEQMRIGTFFVGLDNLITLHR